MGEEKFMNLKKELDNTKPEDLFRAHYQKLCLYALHFVGDVDAAEDIVMEQFVKLVERNNLASMIVSPKSYLYQMVRNASLDFLRKNSTVILGEALPDLPDDADELEAQLGREARLWQQIEALPPACRRILLMNKRDGLAYKEIAEALGLSIKTVEAQIGKAYKTLRGKVHEIYLMLFF